MKFYYEGKLIRTSKTHDYKYAALINEKCLKCSGTKQGAEAEISRLIREAENNIAFYESALQAYEKGSTMVRSRRGDWVKLDTAWYTPENLRDWKESEHKRLNFIKENAKVVELEARA